jgi:glycosyltransferase involved in cell wall biosynthesis
MYDGKSALRITTDIHGLERVAPAGSVVRCFSASRYPSPWKRRVRLLLAALSSDHLVIHFSLPEAIWFAAALALIPFQRCRITTLDFFVGDPRGWRLKLASWSLRRIDRILVYFKDSSVFQRRFGLPAERFYYVPFKINSIELIEKVTPNDGGYIFCGGRSRRDFATLFAAVAPLGYPVKVVTSSEAEMRPHGSSMAGLEVPPNVEVSTNDQSPAFFVQTMAAARLVVIPIVRDSTTQAGIGVYLQAMALGKCVIVSQSLGVSDVLTCREAMIVPPGDAPALRDAIERAWNDDALRGDYGRAALEYASPMGGEDTLRRSVLAALP